MKFIVFAHRVGCLKLRTLKCTCSYIFLRIVSSKKVSLKFVDPVLCIHVILTHTYHVKGIFLEELVILDGYS